MARIFLSHSSGVSTSFAQRLYSWLLESPLGFEVWASFNIEDLGQGTNDHERIAAEAARSDLCICVLAPENITSPWVNFEAGQFYNRAVTVHDQETIRPLYTILVGGLSHKDLLAKNLPLSRIYHCDSSNKKSLQGLLETVYKNHSAQTPRSTIPAPKVDAFRKFTQNSTTGKLLK